MAIAIFLIPSPAPFETIFWWANSVITAIVTIHLVTLMQAAGSRHQAAGIRHQATIWIRSVQVYLCEFSSQSCEPLKVDTLRRWVGRIIVITIRIFESCFLRLLIATFNSFRSICNLSKLKCCCCFSYIIRYCIGAIAIRTIIDFHQMILLRKFFI